METTVGKFDQIRRFFTNEAWIALSELEKKAFCNMKMNYDKMTELGKNAERFAIFIRIVIYLIRSLSAISVYEPAE